MVELDALLRVAKLDEATAEGCGSLTATEQNGNFVFWPLPIWAHDYAGWRRRHVYGG